MLTTDKVDAGQLIGTGRSVPELCPDLDPIMCDYVSDEEVTC